MCARGCKSIMLSPWSNIAASSTMSYSCSFWQELARPTKRRIEEAKASYCHIASKSWSGHYIHIVALLLARYPQLRGATPRFLHRSVLRLKLRESRWVFHEYSSHSWDTAEAQIERERLFGMNWLLGDLMRNDRTFVLQIPLRSCSNSVLHWLLLGVDLAHHGISLWLEIWPLSSLLKYNTSARTFVW